jgi:hypothetical protein
MNAALRRARRTARHLAKHHLDPETGEIMSLRIKQNGQRRADKPTATRSNPKAGAGNAAHLNVRAACCGCWDHENPVLVPLTPVPVTYRKHRSIAAPALA